MELPLYQRLQEPGGYDERVFRQLLHGMTCRRYQESRALVPEAFGLSAGQVSKRFIRVSSKYLPQLQTRSLAAYDFIALFLDGKTFQDDELVMGMGITIEGKKVLLGFVQTGTENAEVCRTFLEGLVERGFQSEQGLLCVIDGRKGLRKAVVTVLGSQVLIQRCQWHKRENVVKHLSKDVPVEYRRKLQAAYEQSTCDKVKQALLRIRRELTTINLSAVESLEEGPEETLTLHRLGIFPQVGISFKTANCMESIMSQVEQKTNKVDNWRNSDQKQRWVATSLLDLEKRLHKVKRYEYLTLLRSALQKELKIVITQKEAA
jgi:transposase-like protein